jgi:hypothetical protein
MTLFNQLTNEIEITIPANSISDLYEYQKSLLGILSHIKINKCDEETRKNLNSIYQLMYHLKVGNNEIIMEDIKEKAI